MTLDLRSEIFGLEVVRLHHRLLLQVLDAADAETHQDLVQTLLDGGLAAVLLQVHHLLEVDLGLTVALLRLRVRGLLVVAHALLPLLHVPDVLDPAREREDGLRVRAVLLLRVGLVGIAPPHGVVLHLLPLDRTGRPTPPLPLLPPIFVKRLRFRRKPHVVLMNLLLLEARAILGGPRRVIGRLRSNTAEGQTRIPKLTLEHLPVTFMLDALSRGENAGPILRIAQLDGGIAQIAFLPVDFLEQFVGLLLGILAVLVQLLLILFQLHLSKFTLTTKLLILRLYFSSSTGRTWFWQAAFQFLFLRWTNCSRSCSKLCLRNTNELYIDKLQRPPNPPPTPRKSRVIKWPEGVRTRIKQKNYQDSPSYQFNQLGAMKTELKQPACPHCGAHALEENDQAQLYCLGCGRVQEHISFSGGVTFANQKMDGQVVDVNEKYNRRATEKRLGRAKAKMEELRYLLKIELDDDEALIPGMRIMRYADSLGFFEKGKTVETYAAAAFYIALRSKQAPYLLVDFSDKMNMNLFKLARCFLKLFKFLDFQSQLPIIDPSLYIHRYCKALDLGSKAMKVTLTAIKLIQRMKRDWMCQGRRPSSLCGAAILIATKIHDVKCSTSDICKTVFVCDETIRRRLEEFKKTSVAKLTKEEFEKMEDQEEGEEMDPPAFQKARLKSKEMEYKKEIEEKLAAMPHRDKMDKIPWQNFRENLNIPEEILVRQVRGVERELQQARERYEDDSASQSEAPSYITEDIFEESDSSEEEVQAEPVEEEEVDSEEIDKFILNEEERKLKKNIWMQHNSAWLEKEKARSKDGEKVEKKRSKKKQGDKAGINAFEAIKNTKLGQKVNIENLKTLLGSSPHEPHKPERMRLDKMFNAFVFSQIRP